MKQPHPYFGDKVVNDVFREAAANVDPSWMWGPTMDQVYANIGDNFTAAVNEGRTLSSALDTVQARTVADIRGRGMSVA
jgi:multiple sugar transport system substrate-binding protein